MEKRILVAFLLSFVVLTAWSALNPPPKNIAKNSQVLVNKEFMVNESAVKTELTQAPIASEPALNEEISTLENDKIKVEFSNIGGTIKKIVIKQFNFSLPLTHIYTVSGFENSSFTLKQFSSNTAIYVLQNGNVRIEKAYTLSANDYTIKTSVQTDGVSNLNLGVYDIDASSLDNKIFQSPQKSLYEYSVGLVNQIVRKNNAIDFNIKENKNEIAEVTWVGYRNQYFCIVVKPDFKSEKYSVVVQDKRKLNIGLSPAKTNVSNYSATIYTGPQNLHVLGSYNQGFENIMVFSSWGILDIIAKAIYFFVHFLHGIFKSWGISIILLGVSLYTITYPLTAKSMSSMRKMQALQPKMKSLQEKYKTDPQRLNKEMMELYRENKVNPFGGCLPMLLQMPIFYGLYQVLWRSESFKGADFLWIKDLSEPDRLATLPFTLPILGNELNILPIAMAIIMFFQQKFTSKNMVVTDENQLMQQKMMLVLMPVMMGFIFYHFASGLSLYFTVFYALSTLTQWKMSKVVEVV